MFHPSSFWLLPVALTTALSAQAAPPPAKADPLDPHAVVPAVRHESALQRDRRQGDVDPRTTWREANDTVGRIGGWRSYAREAQPGPTTAPATPAAPHVHPGSK